MRKLIQSGLIAILGFAFPGFGQASDNQTWTSDLSVDEVFATQNGGFVVSFVEVVNPICQLNGKAVHVVPNENGVSQNGATNMLSVALTAKVSGSKVALRYSGANSSCYVRQLKIK